MATTTSRVRADALAGDTVFERSYGPFTYGPSEYVQRVGDEYWHTGCGAPAGPFTSVEEAVWTRPTLHFVGNDDAPSFRCKGLTDHEVVRLLFGTEGARCTINDTSWTLRGEGDNARFVPDDIEEYEDIAEIDLPAIWHGCGPSLGPHRARLFRVEDLYFVTDPGIGLIGYYVGATDDLFRALLGFQVLYEAPPHWVRYVGEEDTVDREVVE